jgi:hypothetical protein
MRGPRPSGPALRTSPWGAGGRVIAGLGACGFSFFCAFAFALGAASAAGAEPPSACAGDFFAFAGAFVALAPLPKAFAASASSTLEDAVVTSSPAALRAARASFEVMSLSFAISWTRFFAIQ